MAQNSSGFEPGSQDVLVPREPNVRNPQVISPLGRLLSGTGQSFQDATGTVDKAYNLTVENEAKTRYLAAADKSNEFAQSILDSAGTPNSLASAVIPGGTSTMPTGIGDAFEEARGWSLAKGAGKVSNTQYYTQMDLIAKALRQEFPGYRDEVDTQMGILMGHTPANRRHAALDAQLQQQPANQQDQRIAHLEDRLAEEGVSARDDPKAQALKGDKEAYITHLNKTLADRNAYKVGTTAALAGLNVRLKSAEVASAEGAQDFQVVTAHYNNEFMSKLLTSPAGAKFNKAIEDEANGIDMTPDTRRELIAGLRQAQLEHKRGFAALEAQYGGVVPPQKMAEFRKENDDFWDQMTAGVSKHLPNLLTTVKDDLSFNEDYNRARLYKSSSGLQTIGAIRHYAGDITTNAMLQSKAVLGPVEAQIHKAVLNAMGDGSVATPTDAIQKMRDMKRGDLSSSDLIDTAYKNFTTGINEKSTPPATAKAWVNGLFGEDNRKFIGLLPPEKQVEAFSSILSFKNIDRYKELYEQGKIDKQTFDNILPWSVRNAKVLIGKSFKELNDFHSYSGDFSIIYNEVTHQFNMVQATDKEKAATELQSMVGENAFTRNVIGGIDAYYDKSGYTSTQKAIHKVNSVLNSLSYLAEKSGQNVEEVIQRTLQEGKAQIGAPKQVAPNTHNAYTAIINAIETHVKNRSSKPQGNQPNVDYKELQ